MRTYTLLGDGLAGEYSHGPTGHDDWLVNTDTGSLHCILMAGTIQTGQEEVGAKVQGCTISSSSKTKSEPTENES